MTIDAADTAFGYDLICDDLDTRTVLREWLDGTQLKWPGQFRLTAHVSAESPFPLDGRESFHQPTCAIQAGPGTAEVRITWETEPAIAVVHPTLPEASVWLSPTFLASFEAAERTFLLITLVFVLRRLGWYHVHAAALIDPKGRGWLIAGDSNCGKSTTTAFLATQGWQVGTDDIGFLGMSDGSVSLMSVRSRIALRPGGAALLEAKSAVVNEGLSMERRNKQGHWPEDLGASWAPVVVPEILAFPTIGERTAVTPSTPRRTLSAIVQLSQWVLYESAFAQEYLDVLGAVARQSRCIELTLGPDLFDQAGLLEDLVS